MRLAYSLNAYLKYPVEEAIRRVARLGYQGVELLADVPHAWPAGLLPEQKDLIRRTLAETGLSVANLNAFMMNAVADVRHPYWHPSWLEPDRYYRAIRREHTQRALRLAAELGAPTIQTEPGGPKPPELSWHQAARLFYDELMPCVETAEQCGVYLLIEPEPGLLIERFEQYLEFVDWIGSERVGLNFDIGHAFCVGQSPQEWIPRLAQHTRHYHLEDIAPNREHRHLIPGQGAIDLRAVLAAVEATGYDGWITVELYPYLDDPDAAGRSAKQYLDRLLPTI